MIQPERDLERWRDYQESARTRGEDLGIEAWLPQPVPDADNLFCHPWMVRFFAGRSKELVQALGHPRARDFAEVHEMAARPRAWANVDFKTNIPTAFETWSDLSGLGSMLWNRAAGALYSGDEATAVDDLQALLRLGAHLRSQNILLPHLLGSAMESRALGVIETGARKKAFSPESKYRLRTARRTRELGEEIALTLLVERGLHLKHFESFFERPRRSLGEKLSTVFTSPEHVVAANSLFLCEKLDLALSPSPSVAGWRDFARRTGVPLLRGLPGSPIAIASRTISIFGRVVGGFLTQEKQFDRVFKLLGS